jgi:hypothetical protein
MLASLHLFTYYKDEVTVNVKGKGVEDQVVPSKSGLLFARSPMPTPTRGLRPPGEGRTILEPVCND